MITSFRAYIYITILLCDPTHVVSLRKTTLIPTMERIRKILKESKKYILYDKYWRKYPLSVEYSNVHHLFSNVFP